MLSYLFLGANDMVASVRFYDAILTPFGYEKASFDGKVCYSFPDLPDRYNGPGSIYISKPFDGELATVGNGVMPALRASSNEMVDLVHQAGIAAGGKDDGQPGIRSCYGPTFFVAYLRDPMGNKVCVFHKP